VHVVIGGSRKTGVLFISAVTPNIPAGSLTSQPQLKGLYLFWFAVNVALCLLWPVFVVGRQGSLAIWF